MSNEVKDAMDKCNQGPLFKETNRAYFLKWRTLVIERKTERDRKAAWADVSRKVRRTFRSIFRGERWREINIEFSPEIFCVDWSTRKARGYLAYDVFWRGIRIQRNFWYDDISVIVKEAEKLRVMLAHWESGFRVTLRPRAKESHEHRNP